MASYTLKKSPVLYACQLIFCNLYAYNSEKRPLYIKQLAPLAPSLEEKAPVNNSEEQFPECQEIMLRVIKIVNGVISLL